MSIGYGCPHDGEDPNCPCDICQGVSWGSPGGPAPDAKALADADAFVTALSEQVAKTLFKGD